LKNDCIFCAIAGGEIPSHKLYEDDDFIAILDLGPLNPGHTLIIPKTHAADLYALPEETAAKVLPLAKKLAAKIKDELNCDGLNVIQNNGKAAGQSVGHYHTHLIPRYEGDRAITWGAGGKPAPEELAAMAERLAHASGSV
jgi:histidine triad (HIT) family protein